MSYDLADQTVKALKQAQGGAGGRVITSADGPVTGDFAHIDSLTDDVVISAITLKGNWPSPSGTRLAAVNPLPQKPITIGFTSITLSGGTAVIYNAVN